MLRLDGMNVMGLATPYFRTTIKGIADEKTLRFFLLMLVGFALWAPTVQATCSAGRFLNSNSTCVECPVGYACAGDTAAPQPCPPGTFNPNPGQISTDIHCAVCPFGMYSTSFASVTCLPCPAGHSCDSPEALPQECPVSTYSPIGISTCQDCPTGMQCPSPGLAVPIPCTNGTFSSEKQTSCNLCPAGHACPSASSAVPCGVGYFSGIGSSFCKKCPPGTFCPTSTTELPVTCIPGTYSLLAQANCTVCPPGYQCPHPDSLPEVCPDGFYTNGNGSTFCIICEAGRDCSDKASSRPCPPGTYSEQGMLSCTPCLQGFYANSSGMSHCLPCPAGFACTNPGHDPIPCIEGFFSLGLNATNDHIGALQCTPCPIGSISSISHTGCRSCPQGYQCSDPSVGAIPCLEGTYSPGGEIITCTACPHGYFCPARSPQPVPCPGGTFSGQAASECTICPSGFACDPKSGNMTVCREGYFSRDGELTCRECGLGNFCPTVSSGPIKCPSGTFTPTTTEQSCSPCPFDHICPMPSIPIPILCATGSTVSRDKTSCNPCPAGFACATPSAQPLACSLGQYSLEGDDRCQSCPAGFACPSTTQPPQLCPLGSYSVNGSTHCTSCSPGFACPSGFDISRVQLCHNGTYSLGAATECTPCPAGHLCLSTTSLPQSRCPSGTFSLLGESTCTLCNPGQSCLYPDRDPSPCPPGSFSTSGQLDCTECPPGFYCPTTTSDLILPCPLGSYSLQASTSCTVCPAGNACPSPFGDTRISCPDGFFALSNSTACTPCPAGHRCPHRDQDVRIPCLAGSYALGAARECMDCPPGNYCPDTVSAPRACPTGSYSAGGTSQCLTCPAGHACDSNSRMECDEGTWSPTNSTYCRPCNPGYLCLAEDAPHSSPNAYPCQAGGYCDGKVRFECPDGMFGNQQGKATLAEACQECPAGSFCDGRNDGATSPEPCPDGYFCPPSTGYYDLQACPSGFFASGGSKESFDTGCKICPAGSYCPEASITPLFCPQGYFCPPGTREGNQHACPSGTYGNAVGLQTASNCTTCPPGYYCPDGHNTHPPVSPLPCPGGTYNPFAGAGSLVDCVPCPAGRSCPGTARIDTELCEEGHYCPRSTVSSQLYPCPPGTLTGASGLKAAEECSSCPPGFACGWGTAITTSVALPCAQGHYCPSGTPTPTSFPCPAGSFTPFSNLTARSQCTECPARFYCNGGETAPTDWCPPGYFCPPQTQTYFQHPCPARTYQPGFGSFLSAECINCSTGHYCEQATVTPVPCPAGTYMPFGSQENKLNGSLNSRVFHCKLSCRNQTDFLHFSVTELELCEQGCEHAQNCTTQCNSHNQTLSSNLVQACLYGCDFFSQAQALVQIGISAGAASDCLVCPGGYRCDTGTVEPIPCGLGFFSRPGSSHCLQCPAGFVCDETSLGFAMLESSKACESSLYCRPGLSSFNDTEPCPRGHYCPHATPRPITCPMGTFNPNLLGKALSDCRPCVAGMYCIEASVHPSGDCDRGFYCPTNITATQVLNGEPGLIIGSHGPKQIPCPGGTYRNATGGRFVSDCVLCPEGFFCPVASAIPHVCSRGFYCPPASNQPIPCPSGTLGNNTGLTKESDCQACPGGFFCDRHGSWQTTGPCDGGFVCIGGASMSAPTDNITGTICPPGGYCPPGSAQSEPCPKGTFNNVTGSVDENDCVPCTPGFYCASTRSPGPTGPCTAGYYCTSESSTPQQHVTPSGHFTPAGSAAPILCPPGSFQPESGQGACLPCLEGYYCPDFGMNTCFECPKGYFCPEGSASFSGPNGNQRCPVGTFGPFARITNVSGCIDCPPGMYCANPVDGSGLTLPTGKCAAGFVCYGRGEFASPGLEGLDWGEVCPRGYYCPPGTETPIPCPPGTFSNIRGLISSEQCTPCPAARYCPQEGMTTFGPFCEPGYYCTSAAAISRPLSANSIQLQGLESLEYYYSMQNLTLNLTQLDSCGLLDFGGDICPQGHYCPTGIEAEYNPGFPPFVWEGGPILCQEGTYANFTGATSCKKCPAGYACFNRNPFDPNPLPCPRGRYCPEGTGSNIPTCPVGTFNNMTNLQAIVECTPCLPGLVCSAPGLGEPNGICSVGFWCNRGAFSTTPSSSSPIAAQVPFFEGGICPSGFYCEIGTTLPKPCPAGTISNSIQATSSATCNLCPSGHYCEIAGSVSVTGQCDEGYYCIEGALSPRPNDGITGDICPAGTFCPRGSTIPISCSNGTYNPFPGQSVCMTCPPGFFCDEAATNFSITACSAGYYCPSGSSHDTQVPCPVGTYLNTTGAATKDACLPCIPGFYCPAKGISWPKLPCAPGWFCQGGASVAKPLSNDTAVACPLLGAGGRCQPGTYCPEGSSAPISCEAGRACTLVGLASSDVSCAPGYVCIRGAFRADPSDGETGYICPAGHYCPEGSSTTTPCPVGTYSITTGADTLATCHPCPLGHACPDLGTVVPIPCAQGYHCSLPGSNTTTPAGLLCDVAHFCPQGTTQQQPCPSGKYQDEPGSHVCKVCPARFFCDATHAPIANGTGSSCPPGHFCPEGTGKSTTHRCPAGTINAQFGLSEVSECQPCPGGKYCPTAGRTDTAGPCHAGYYCVSSAVTPQPLDGVTGNVCPTGNYCPYGTIQPIACPAGTRTVLPAQDEVTDCLPCAAGRYCVNGTDAGVCSDGYVCVQGSWTPTPTLLVNDTDLGFLKGGYMCPNGTYCPAGATEARVCDRGTYSPHKGLAACFLCPSGQLCDTLGTIMPTSCPQGYFCPEATTKAKPCPSATYGSRPSLGDIKECTLCDSGHFCDEDGLFEPKGLCMAGYFCAGGDTTPAPAGPTTHVTGDVEGVFQVVYTTVFIDGSEVNVTSGTCPRGHFCNNGTDAPVACQPGTFNPDRRGPNSDACLPCSGGNYCEGPGQTSPTGLCSAGYFCPASALVATSKPLEFLCPKGHHCTEGTSEPQPCPDGEYQNESGQSMCKPCPAGFICELHQNSSVIPRLCPVRYICEEGTGAETLQFCSNGTYGAAAGYSRLEDCVDCPPGFYCNLGVIEGECHAGFICRGGSQTPQPDGTNPSIGSPCPAGFVCPQGTLSPQLCSNGSVVIEGLELQQVQVTAVNNEGELVSVTRNITVPTLGVGAASFDACTACPPSLVCSGALATMCPTGHYCPPQSSEPIPCETGFYNSLPASSSPADCNICPSGYWCRYLGTSDFSGIRCPQGYYCTAGTIEPTPCPPGTWSNHTGATTAFDCQECPPGFFCSEVATTRVTQVCPPGWFCPAGSAAPRVCTAGYFCPTQSDAPRPSPPNYYSPFNASDPIICPSGHYCPPASPNASTIIDNYPSGATEALLCPLGYRDRVEGGGNHDRTSLEAACVACEAGKYGSHPQRVVCFDCEPGFVCLEGAIFGNPDLWSHPGHGFNSSRDRLLFVNGNPYSNLVELKILPYTGVGFNYSVNGFPDSKSYQCPPGHFCPRQSPFPLPCPPGTYNANNRSTSAEACLLCPAGTYNNRAGQSFCRRCGTSSISEAGSSICTCRGENRVFSPADATCICRQLFASREGATTLLDVEDGVSDCQPIVFDNCPEGSVMNEHGQCLSRSGWRAYCDQECPLGPTDRVFDAGLGRCLCKIPSLDNVCDQTCRSQEQQRQQIICESPPRFVINTVAPDGSTIELKSFLTSELGGLFDIGMTACDALDGRRLSSFLMIATDDGLTGGYDIPIDIWESLEVSDGESRRRRRSGTSYNVTSDNAKISSLDLDLSSISINTHNDHMLADTSFARLRRTSLPNGWQAQLPNPVTCLELGSVIFFSVNGTHYPKYDKNNLLNRQDDPYRPFIHSPLTALAEELQSNPSPRLFAYAFTSPGVWVLQDAATGRTSIFSVMNDNVQCPQNGPFFPATSSSQHLMAVSRDTSLVVAPDWVLMAIILAAAILLVLIIVVALVVYRRYGWIPAGLQRIHYRHLSNKFPIEDMSSKGSQRERVQRINRKALAYDLSDEANAPPSPPVSSDSKKKPSNYNISRRLKVIFDDDFWDYERQVDLENFTSETLFNLVDERTEEIRRQIQSKTDEVESVYEKIRHEASLLKSLWVSKLRLARPVALLPLSSEKTMASTNQKTAENQSKYLYQKELETRKVLGDKWYHALLARRDMLGSTFKTSNDIYKVLLSQTDHVRTQMNLIISLQRFVYEKQIEPDVLEGERNRCIEMIEALNAHLDEASEDLCCKRLINQSDQKQFGGLLLPPENDPVGDSPISTDVLRDPIDGGLIAGAYIQPAKDIQGLYSPVVGTRILLNSGIIIPASPCDHVIHPQSCRVLQRRGNLAYNMVTRKLFVVADYNNISTHAAPLPYIPWPQTAVKGCKFSDGSALQSSLQSDGTMVHSTRGITVPVLACTTHPETFEIVPVGGVFLDPLTGLLTAIQRYLPGPINENRDTIVVDIDINEEGEAIPVCVPIDNLDLHTHIPAQEPFSGAKCFSNHISLGMTAQYQTETLPSAHGISWISGLDALCFQSYYSCLREMERLPNLLANSSVDSMTLSSSLATAVSNLDAHLRDIHSIFKRTSKLKHSLFSEILLRFADALHVREDGGILGHLDEYDIPLFAGQLLIDRETKLEVPVLGVIYEQENSRHVPLGGVMHNPNAGCLLPINIGESFVDPETGEFSIVQGARMDSNTGRVVPSRMPSMKQQTFNLGDEDMLLLEEELAARRAWQRRSANQDAMLLREVQLLMTSALEMGSTERRTVSQHLETLAETLKVRWQQMRREQQRRKQQQDQFMKFPGVLTALLFLNEKQEATLHVSHLQHFEGVLEACQRFLNTSEISKHDPSDNTKAASPELDEAALDAARLEFSTSLSTHLALIHESKSILLWIAVDDELRASVVKDILGKLFKEQQKARSGEDEGHTLTSTLENLISVLQHQLSMIHSQSLSSLTSSSGHKHSGSNHPSRSVTPVRAMSSPKSTSMSMEDRNLAQSPLKQHSLEKANVKSLDKPTTLPAKTETSFSTSHWSTPANNMPLSHKQDDSSQLPPPPIIINGIVEEDKASVNLKQRPTPQNVKSSGPKTQMSKAEVEKMLEHRTQARTSLYTRLNNSEQTAAEELLSLLHEEEQRYILQRTAETVKALASTSTEKEKNQVLEAYQNDVTEFRKKHNEKALSELENLKQNLVSKRFEALHHHERFERDTFPDHPDLKPMPAVSKDRVANDIQTLLLEQQQLISSLVTSNQDDRLSGTEGDKNTIGGVTKHIHESMEAFAKHLTSQSSLHKSKQNKTSFEKSSQLAAEDLTKASEPVLSSVQRLQLSIKQERDRALTQAKTPEAQAQIQASYNAQMVAISENIGQFVENKIHETQYHLLQKHLPENEQEAAAELLADHRKKMETVHVCMQTEQRDRVLARIAAQKRIALQRRRQQSQKFDDTSASLNKGEAPSIDTSSLQEQQTFRSQDERALARQAELDVEQDESARDRLAELELAHIQRLEELEAKKQARMRELAQELEKEFQKTQEQSENELTQHHQQTIQAASVRLQVGESEAKHSLSPEEYDKFMREQRQQLADVQAKLEQSQRGKRQALQERLKAQRERRRKAQEAALEAEIEKELTRQSEERQELQSTLERTSEEKVLSSVVHNMTNNLTVEEGDTPLANKETIIHRVMHTRHLREFQRLVERCALDREHKLRHEMGKLQDERAEEREVLEERFLAEMNDIEKRELNGEAVPQDERFKIKRKLKTALVNFDKKTARLQEQIEARVTLHSKTEVEQQKFALKQRQYTEMVEAFKNFTPESEIHAQYEEAAEQARQAAEKYTRQLGEERNRELARLKAEQERLRNERKAKMEAERQRVEEELEQERKKQEQLMQQKHDMKKQQMMEKMRKEQEKELEQLDEVQRKEVVDRHRQGLKNLEDALESEQDRQRSKFYERLSALREKKKEARLRELEEAEAEEHDREEEEMMAKELEMQEELHSKIYKTVAKHDMRPKTPFIGRKKQPSRTIPAMEVPRDETALTLLDEGLQPLLPKLATIEALLAGQVYGDGGSIVLLGDSLEEEWHKMREDKQTFSDENLLGECNLIPENSLSISQLRTLQLANAVCELAAKSRVINEVQVKFAKRLPLPEDNQHAFRYSYRFVPQNQQLLIRLERGSDPSQTMIVLLHALAHIKVGQQMSDASPLFQKEFRALIRHVCFDIFLAGLIRRTSNSDEKQQFEVILSKLREHVQTARPLLQVLEDVSEV